MATLEERLAAMGRAAGDTGNGGGNGRGGGDLAARLQAMGEAVSGPDPQPGRRGRGDELPDIGAGASFARAGLESFLDNFFELPENTINAVSAGARAIENMTGGIGIPGSGAFAKLPEVDFPNPSAQDVFAGAQLAGEAAGALRTGDFGQFSSPGEARAQQAAVSEQARREHPVATGAGEAVGDAATLLTGRAPMAAGRARLKPAARAELDPGVRKLADDIMRSGPVQRLKRTAGRATEAGFEGTALAIMNEGDPVEMAAMGAGGQAIGSTLLSLAPSTRRGAVGFAVGVGTLAALARFGQEFSPGQNNLFAASDVAFEKAKLALLAGGLSAVGGLGRLGGPKGIGKSLSENLPDLADAVTAIPRGTVLSLANTLNREEQNGVRRTGPILDTLQRDPDFFGSEVRKKVERGIKNNKLNDVIDGLFKDPNFRERFKEIQ